MDRVQLDFGICFTNEEWDRGLGLNDLIEIVEAKMKNPEPQRRLAEKRVREARAALVGEPVKFGIITGCLFLVPAALGEWVVRVVLATLWLVVVIAIVWMNMKQYRLARSLVARMASRAR